MNLIKPVLDFMMSDELVYEANNSKFDSKLLVKVPLEGNKFINVYERDNANEEDTLAGISTRFVFIYDIEKNDIVYTNRAISNNSGYSYYAVKYIENITDKDVQNMNNIIEEIKNAMSENVLNKMNSLEEKVLSKIDLEKYSEEAKDKYMRKESLPNPFLHKYFTITPSLINFYYNDNDKFIEKCYEQINDSDFESYENYVGVKYALKAYEKELEGDPIKGRKKAICDIINNDKYKTITVNYRLPNGSLLSEKINKTRAYNENIKKTIMEKDHMQNIPITLIESITWSKQILYDTNKFTELNLSEEDKYFEFAKCGNIKDLPPKSFSNPSLMKRIILNDSTNIFYLDDSLKGDSDFILDLVKDCSRHDTYRVYESLPTTLKGNRSFMTKFLELGITDPIPDYKYWDNRYNNFMKSFIDNTFKLFSKNINFSLLTIDKLGIYNADLCDLIPQTTWNDERMINVLKNTPITDANCRNIIKFIDKSKDAEKIFTLNQLKKNIDFMNDNLIYDEDFLIRLLSDKEVLCDCSFENVISKYQEDEKIMNLIIDNIHEPIQAKHFTSIMHSSYDSDERFELANKNIIFFSELSEADKETFVDGELFDKDELNIYVKSSNMAGDVLYIEAPNSTYQVVSFGQIRMVKDDKDLNIVRYRNNLTEKILEVLNYRFPECKGLDIKTKVPQIIKLEKEKNQTLER